MTTSPQLHTGEIPRTRETSRNDFLDIDITSRLMMGAPHLEKYESSGHGWVETNGALALLLLDKEPCVGYQELAAADGTDGFLGGAVVSFPCFEE